MSSDMYRTRVYYDAHTSDPDKRGIAKSEGVEIKLYESPKIEGLPQHIVFLDYAPQVRVAMLTESAKGPARDMYPPEVVALARWLGGLVAAVRRFRKAHG